MTTGHGKILTPQQVEADPLPTVSHERKRFLVEYVNEKLRTGERSFFFTLPECDFVGAVAAESGWAYVIQRDVPLVGGNKVVLFAPKR